MYVRQQKCNTQELALINERALDKEQMTLIPSIHVWLKWWVLLKNNYFVPRETPIKIQLIYITKWDIVSKVYVQPHVIVGIIR